MNRRPHRNHTPAFKAKVALAAIEGDSNTGSTGGAVQIRSHRGKRSWKVGLPMFSVPGGNGAAQPVVDVKSLHAKIGEAGERFLEGALRKAGLRSAKR